MQKSTNDSTCLTNKIPHVIASFIVIFLISDQFRSFFWGGAGKVSSLQPCCRMRQWTAEP